MEKPYSTPNAMLASALIVAGFPPLDAGELCVNIYTAKHPFKAREDDPKAPARPGLVEYIFQSSDALKAAVTLWDAEVERIMSAAKRARQHQDATVAGPTLKGDYPGDIILLSAWLFYTHDVTSNLWRTADPKIWARKRGSSKSKTLPDGGTLMTQPGFVLVSRNSSPETLKRLKLQ